VSVLRHVVRLAAVTFAVAAAGVVTAPPGQAATCSASSGVTVVVDFHQLGQGRSAICDPSGGGDAAADLFTAAGHTLTYVDGEPFVCQVDGAPVTQCARTPPADAYWSLWWSDGRSGSWKYASNGATALHVPDGGYVALSWQKGNAQVPPGIAARSHSPSSPTSHPTTHPTSAPPSSAPAQAPTSSPPSVPTSTAPDSPAMTPSSRTGGHHHAAKPARSARPHHHSSKGPGEEAEGPVSGVTAGGGVDGGSGSGGLPGWVAPVAVVAVFAVGGTITLIRRKSSGGA
jgi:hypothetical protein